MCKDTNKKTRTLQNIHLNLGKDTNENGVHTGLTSLIAPVYNFLDLSTGIVSRYLTWHFICGNEEFYQDMVLNTSADAGGTQLLPFLWRADSATGAARRPPHQTSPVWDPRWNVSSWRGWVLSEMALINLMGLTRFRTFKFKSNNTTFRTFKFKSSNTTVRDHWLKQTSEVNFHNLNPKAMARFSQFKFKRNGAKSFIIEQI
jgi:hypothetical protein